MYKWKKCSKVNYEYENVKQLLSIIVLHFKFRIKIRNKCVKNSLKKNSYMFQVESNIGTLQDRFDGFPK